MEKTILVEGSARHVHLKKETVEKLFGKGVTLTFKRELSQPGQFLSEQRVELIGEKGSIKNVAVLGPERAADQVELSFTDTRMLGIDAPVRESGDVKGSGKFKLVGTEGEVEIPEGAIVAKRHIHLTPEIAKEYGLADKQIVKVFIKGEREVIFGQTVIRVSEKFAPAMHIDIDELNAAGIKGTATGIILD